MLFVCHGTWPPSPWLESLRPSMTDRVSEFGNQASQAKYGPESRRRATRIAGFESRRKDALTFRGQVAEKHLVAHPGPFDKQQPGDRPWPFAGSRSKVGISLGHQRPRRLLGFCMMLYQGFGRSGRNHSPALGSSLRPKSSSPQLRTTAVTLRPL